MKLEGGDELFNPIYTGVKFRSHIRGGADSAPLLENTPGGLFGTKLSMRTKFGPNFQKNHI